MIALSNSKYVSISKPSSSPCNYVGYCDVQIQIQIQRRKQANTNTTYRGTLLFRYEQFIDFWLRFFDTRRETQFLKVFRKKTVLNPPTTFGTSRGCLRSQFISAGRDPKDSTLRLKSRIPNSQLYGRNLIVSLHGPMLTFNSVFLKSSDSQPISSGHDVIHTPGLFPVWCLLWQWWLSYSLRTSVKLSPMAM